METLSSSGFSDILPMKWGGGGEDTVGRNLRGLGEGVRLGFRNADFSGVFTGRGLSTNCEVSLLVGVLAVSWKLVPPLYCVEIWSITGFSGPRGKLFCLADFGGEAWGMRGGWMFACITSASCFSTSLTDGGALIDSNLLFGFIEILVSRLNLTASSTMLIRFV